MLGLSLFPSTDSLEMTVGPYISVPYTPSTSVEFTASLRVGILSSSSSGGGLFGRSANPKRDLERPLVFSILRSS